jgi:hypothetical protein
MNTNILKIRIIARMISFTDAFLKFKNTKTSGYNKISRFDSKKLNIKGVNFGKIYL